MTNNVENLILLGADNINGTGNSQDNWIQGNSGNNLLNGGAGNDTLIGLDGDDILKGGYGNNFLFGSDGNDTLYGGIGSDSDGLYGGNGNDYYTNLSHLDVIEDAGGYDTVDLKAYKWLSDSVNVSGEDFFDAAGNIGQDGLIDSLALYLDSGRQTVLVGHYFSNTASSISRSSAGFGVIENLQFQDTTVDFNTIYQYLYNQPYYSLPIPPAQVISLNLLPVIYPAIEPNTLETSGSSSAPNPAPAPALTPSLNMMTGTPTNDQLYGTSGSDSIQGFAGDDHIWGQAGNDTLYGGAGGDTYHFENNWGVDSIIDSRMPDGSPSGNVIAFEGATTSVTINMLGSATAGSNSVTWQNGQIFSSAIGGEGNDVLIGGPLFNNLWGQGGNDELRGAGADDALMDGGGNDILIGGKGNDSLYGDYGNDTYCFAKGDGQDVITDYGDRDLLFFDNSINQSVIAIFKTLSGNLQIGYTDSAEDQIAIQNFGSAGAVERFELNNGLYMTDADMNQLVSNMAAYASANGVSFTSLNDVKSDSNLMAIVNGGWHT